LSTNFFEKKSATNELRDLRDPSHVPQNQLQVFNNGVAYSPPNWKRILDPARISRAKFRKYVVLRFLFKQERGRVNSYQLEALIDLLEPVTITYRNSGTLWPNTIQSLKEREDILFSSILAYILEYFIWLKLEHAFFLPMYDEHRKAIIALLEEKGYPSLALKRAFDGQYTFYEGTWNRIQPLPPSRRRAKPRRRRRSSEDRAGKSRRSNSGVPWWQRMIPKRIINLLEVPIKKVYNPWDTQWIKDWFTLFHQVKFHYW
jgi:hypothetical protein